MKQIFIISILCIFQQVSAQSLQGKITSINNITIADAHIFNKNNNQHTHSNIKGEFSLNQVSLGDTLLITHVNYNSKILIVKKFEVLVVVLEQKTVSLEEVVVNNTLDVFHAITAIDIQANPVNSSQDILQQVPGLIIGQHAGGGKAEQIFLRGFDIDHGTDIAISADGMPVNMVSHAHGQGYADLHFVIPETVNAIDFGKGLYYANKGNFNTAGYVDFKSKEKLNNNLIKLEIGQFNTRRLLGMFNILSSHKQNAYIASEYLMTDGYFDSPQNFNRLNIFGKYTNKLSVNDKFGLAFSRFSSKWDASGQIPQRSVDNKSISRFGSIDDTEGGSTTRTNFTINYDKTFSEKSSIKNTVFFSNYTFELFSNFTFFLDDAINGDQIKQKENRNIFGLNSDFIHHFNGIDAILTAGVHLRNDQSYGNELSHTVNRNETLKLIQKGNINETNFGAYVSTDFYIGRFTINPAIRFDYFDFQYNDLLQKNYKTNAISETVISPKLNILYNHNENLQLYIKAGKGFHSNDTRVVIAQDGKEILPDAYGADAGLIWKPFSNLLVSTAYWYLFLAQEFVYVGDAGIVEPSGKTRRQGVDASLRYEPVKQLYFNLNANYTYARAIDEQEGDNYIPLAPSFTFTTAVGYKSNIGIYGGVQLKHINDRPANEDNSIIAKGYTVTNMNLGYQIRNFDLGIQIQNVFDVEWNETQFATESRLKNEAESIEEIHFTPGSPFLFKGMLSIRF